MSDKVLGNDPFAEMGMLAPASHKERAPRKDAKGKTEKTKKAEPPQTKKTAASNKQAQKAEKPVAANKNDKSKSVVTAKPEPAKKNVKTPQAKPEAKAIAKKAPKTTVKSETKPLQKEVMLPEAAPLTAEKKLEVANYLKEKTPNTFITEVVNNKPEVLPDNDINKIRHIEEHCLKQEQRLDPVCQHRLQPLVDILYRYVWRVKVVGIENIPADGRAVLVANHAGIAPYDSLMIRAALFREHPQKREVWPLMEDFIYHIPFLGTLMSRIGMARACPEDATSILKNEKLALVFLEGIGIKPKPYSRRHELQRFSRGGFLKLALKLNAPIIPVALKNVGDKAGFMSSRWSIIIGKPINPENCTTDAAVDPSALSRLAHNVRSTLQKMLNKDNLK